MSHSLRACILEAFTERADPLILILAYLLMMFLNWYFRWTILIGQRTNSVCAHVNDTHNGYGICMVFHHAIYIWAMFFLSLSLFRYLIQIMAKQKSNFNGPGKTNEMVVQNISLLNHRRLRQHTLLAIV